MPKYYTPRPGRWRHDKIKYFKGFERKPCKAKCCTATLDKKTLRPTSHSHECWQRKCKSIKQGYG